MGGDHRLHGDPSLAGRGSLTRRNAGGRQYRRCARGARSCCDCLSTSRCRSCSASSCLSCIGLFGFVTSRHGYAWLVGTVTACLIMLMSFDQPQGAFDTAVNRVIDVMIGTAASLAVCALSPIAAWVGVASPASLLEPPPLAFWRRRYGDELRRWLPGQWAIARACLPRRADRHADAGAGGVAGSGEPDHNGRHRGHGHVDPDDRHSPFRQPRHHRSERRIASSVV